MVVAFKLLLGELAETGVDCYSQGINQRYEAARYAIQRWEDDKDEGTASYPDPDLDGVGELRDATDDIRERGY
jgi:hypothetical protein